MPPSPRRPHTARPTTQRPASTGDSNDEGSVGKEERSPPAKAEWQVPSGVSRDFGPPPSPRLSFLQPPPLCSWQQDIKSGQDVTINDVGKFRKEDGVKILTGTVDLNVPGRPPRPRSAVILRKDLADLKVPPRASQPKQPEAIYLVHCDSTDTTLARGPDHWYPERALEARPIGSGRDFCSDGRAAFSKKYGGIVGLTFEQIERNQQRFLNPPVVEEKVRKPMERSGKAALPPAWIPEHEALWKDTPKLRRRKFCPPPRRVRNSPRQERYTGNPRNWVSSMESPRSRIMVGDLDYAPPPPRPKPRVLIMDDDELLEGQP